MCTRWTRQDWLDFVVISLSVEGEPEVAIAMRRRAEAREKMLGKPGGPNSASFSVGGKKG